MLLSNIIANTEYRGSFSDRDIENVTSVSSNAGHNSLFVCVKGFRADGHDFALGAYAQGCRDFIAEHLIDGLPDDANVIYVENSRRALAHVSAEFYGNPSKRLKVIGITGTKGKTTTALMIKHILDKNGIPTGYIGSNGIIYGDCKLESVNTTPESTVIQSYMRSMADAGMKCLAIEVSSQALDMHRVDGIEFDICAFTNFSPDHIGENEHPSLEAYFEAKKKLFDRFKPEYALANADDAAAERILSSSGAQKKLYAIDKSAEITAKNIELIRDGAHIGVSFELCFGNEAIPCSLPFPGEFNVYNALCAVSAASLAGVSISDAIGALETAQIDGRFEVHQTPRGVPFIIDYAHNGKSLSSVLMTLRKYTEGRLICVFGSVGGRTQIRRTEMGRAASEYADLSILTADNPDFESVDSIIDDIAREFGDDKSYIRIPDREEAIGYAYSLAKEGDIVLLAGKGHEKYQLIAGKKEYFCEAEILKNCITKDRELASKA